MTGARRYTLEELRLLFRGWLDEGRDDDLFWHIPGLKDEDEDLYCGEKLCFDGRALPFPLWLEQREQAAED